MRTYKFGDKSYLIELRWRQLAGMDRRELSAIAAEEGSHFAAKQEAKSFVALGFTDGGNDRTPSAAAMLANAARTSGLGAIAVIEKLAMQNRTGEDLYWLCAIDANGLPIPGGDIVGIGHMISQRIDSIAGMGGLTVYTNTDIYAGDPSRDFLDLIKDEPYKPNVGRVYRSYAPMIAMSIIILGGAGWWLYAQQMSGTRNATAQKLANVARIARMKQEDIEKEQQKFAAAVKAALHEYEEIVSKPGPAAMGRVWFRIMNSVPVSIKGWDLVGSECQNTQCQVIYERRHRSRGTAEDFRQGAARYGRVDLDLPKKGIVVIQVEGLERRTPRLDALPELEAFGAKFVSAMQSVDSTGVEFKYVPAAEVPAIKSPDGTNRKMPYRKGLFKLSGTHIFELNEIPGVIDSQNVTLERARVDFKRLPHGIGWTMEGTYVVQN